MTTMTIQLSDTLHDHVENIAQQEGMSINQFVISAVTDKITTLLKMPFWSQSGSGDIQDEHQTGLADATSNGQVETVKALSEQQQFNIAMQSMMVDKMLLQEGMNNLLSTQSIQGEPIGVDALREQMKSANLAPNELSQSIIMARDE